MVIQFYTGKFLKEHGAESEARQPQEYDVARQLQHLSFIIATFGFLALQAWLTACVYALACSMQCFHHLPMVTMGNDDDFREGIQAAWNDLYMINPPALTYLAPCKHATQDGGEMDQDGGGGFMGGGANGAVEGGGNLARAQGGGWVSGGSLARGDFALSLGQTGPWGTPPGGPGGPVRGPQGEEKL